MGAVYFYHLTRRPLEVTLPTLLEKSLQAGWRVYVRGTDPAALAALDRQLWLEPAEGFLPHGFEGGPQDGNQPVLLGTSDSAANGAQCVMSVQGADLTPEEIKAAERACVLFDGQDPDALAKARSQWKALTDAGCAAQYWSEESGAWQKKAEKG